MPGRTAEPSQIYQLRATLRGSRPPIWRQFQVGSDITLAKLHRILQAVMGWGNIHLHQFVIRGKRYGAPKEDEFGTSKTTDGRKVKLRDVVPGQNFRFAYKYDFGDGWEHELLVENVLATEEGVRYPVCLTGTSACPPEDVGGIAGYESFLEAIDNPQHPKHEGYMEWIGRNFDPEAFDVDEINRRLRWLK